MYLLHMSMLWLALRRNGPQPLAKAKWPEAWTSRKKSAYIRKTSSRRRILASRLHCFCSGWAWTMLCKALPTRRRTSEDCCSPLCRIRTRKGMTRWFLIMSQLVGVEDIAKKVVDILSMSEPPRSVISESTHSIFVSKVSLVEDAVRRSLFNEWTEDVKLITEAESSWK